MRCQKCSAENPPGAKFCIQCAASFQRRCLTCASDNPPEARFCAQCATPLAEPPAAALGTRDQSGHSDEAAWGERRHLTVLFCDLVGSTSIATRLDPEEWRGIVGSYHRAAAQAIEHFGGYVAQYLGDGVMAFFGYPEAHDNDAERAVRAGLAIVESIAKLNQAPPPLPSPMSDNRGEHRQPKLAARVGIHSGEVVVGAGVDGRSDVFGDAPNIAARLQAAAEPATVLITEDTYRLVSGGFDVEERGAQILKGLERPVPLYNVLQPRGARGRPGTERSLTPFIGRADELRVLQQGLEKIDDAFAIVKRTNQFGDVFLLYLVKGELLLMKNAAGLRRARQAFGTALDIARKQDAKSDELRATIPVAKLMVQQGRREQARAMLSKIYHWFTEGFDTADLKEAKALLEQLHS
jgi:class 3 adenylate cyclase